MVGDVVLRRVGSCRGIPGQLAVRGQDIGDGQTAVIDEVAAVVVLCRAVLGDRQLVATRIVDVGNGTRRTLLDGSRQFQVVVCQGQGAQAVGLHRAVGVVLEGLAAPVALERPQPVRAAGIGVGQRLGTGSRPRQGGDVAVCVVLNRLAVAAAVRARRQPAVAVIAVGVGLRRAAGVLPRRSADVAAILRRGARLVGVRDGELVRPQRRGIVDPRQAVADVPGIVQRLVARSQDPRGLAAGAVPGVRFQQRQGSAVDTLEDLRLAARIVIAVLAKHRCRRAPDGLLLLRRRDLALVAVLRASPV